MSVDPEIEQDFIKNRSRIFTWTLTQGETGTPIVIAGHQDKTVHFYGTFGGATVTLQGSNDKTLTNWVTIKSATGADLVASSAEIDLIAENPIYIRPVVNSAGSNASIKVVICARIV